VFCLAKPTDFFRAVYQSSRLKFILAWVTFGGLVIPTAFLMSFGFPEKYALPLMLVAIPPFQYAVFCILKGLNRNEGTVVARTDTREFPVLFHDISEFVIAYVKTKSKDLNVQAGQLETDLLQAQFERPRAEGEFDRLVQELLNLKIDAVKQIQPQLERKIQDTSILSLGREYIKITATLDSAMAFLNAAEAENKSRDEMVNLQRKPLDWRTEAKHLPILVSPNMLQYE